MAEKISRIEIDDPQGGRNTIRPGDPVRVKKPSPGEWGFRARYMWCDVDADTGEVNSITVYGGRGYDPAKHWTKQKGRGEYRSLQPSSINRMARTRHGRKVTR